MNDLKKLRERYYKETKMQKQGAWKEKDNVKAFRIREKEKINYEKWKLLDGIIKAKEKGEKNEGINNK